MSYNIRFEIEDGKIDPQTLVTSGTLPDGVVSVSGHHDDWIRSASLNIDELAVTMSARIPPSSDE